MKSYRVVFIDTLDGSLVGEFFLPSGTTRSDRRVKAHEWYNSNKQSLKNINVNVLEIAVDNESKTYGNNVAVYELGHPHVDGRVSYVLEIFDRKEMDYVAKRQISCDSGFIHRIDILERMGLYLDTPGRDLLLREHVKMEDGSHFMISQYEIDTRSPAEKSNSGK